MAALIAVGVITAPVRAAEPDAGVGAREDPALALSVEGGLVALALGVEAEVQTRWGLVVGGGTGVRRGPALNGYLGYHLPLGKRVALRPGFRAARLWQQNDLCGGGTCTFDSYAFEAAIRYQGPGGFVFEYGLPLLAWLPVGPGPGETQPHLKAYTLATGETALFGTLLFGYTF